MGYWERENYLGIGLGASSLVDNVRYRNTDRLFEYLTHSKELDKVRLDEEVLSIKAQMEEFIFLGLRKIKGISIEGFEKVFSDSLDKCYGDNIKRMQEKKLLMMEDGFLKLTKKGIDVSNYVFAEILYEE